MKKKTVLLSAVVFGVICLLSCLKSRGQNVKVDSRSGEVYALIDSVPCSGLYGCWLTRMCLRQVMFLPNSVTYNFCVQRANVVDSTTTNYYDSDIKGCVTLGISNQGLAIGTAYLMLWQYAADSARVNGIFGVNVNFDNVRTK